MVTVIILTFQCGAATEYPLGTLLLGAERKSSRAGPATTRNFHDYHAVQACCFCDRVRNSLGADKEV